ncbi:FabD/lysophospholipase-like protein [Mycena sanguinolenta]|uniref:FabD/lysophospholipase-like protein n=1 Tax=Mycena sanguinolenta TaxID=230812 RepID=A0A8H7D333_9AGAR|nr:FabD/lysophospholipase-like protein [Mycena sanguinolenta]
MEESDAIALLLQRACQQSSPANTSLAAEIVKELAYLPLAIIQAGAFILESRSLGTFLSVYQKDRTKLLKRKPGQGHDDYAWTVYTTWQMSFDKLRKPAATFLLLCSFLHRDGITEEIFSRAAAYMIRKAQSKPRRLHKPKPKSMGVISPDSPQSQIPNARDFLGQFVEQTGKWDSFRFLELTNQIKEYSLINFDENQNSFSIHPLVHSWSRMILENPEAYAQCMNNILGMSILEIPPDNLRLTSVRLVSHVHFFMQTIPGVGNEFYLQYAKIYHEAGEYANAIKLGVITLNKCRKLLGDNNLHTVIAMENLAITYDSLHQLEEAEKLQVGVLEMRKKLLGDDHLHTLKAMNNLASTYEKLGQLEKAKKLQVVVLERRKKLLGNDHLDTLSALQNLSNTYAKHGQLEEAEKRQIVVLEKRKKLLGENHVKTMDAMHNLASIYAKLGAWEEAEKLQIVVLEKWKKFLGDSHLHTLKAMSNLASTYEKLGQMEEAEKLRVLVLERRRKLLGDDHLDTLLAMNNVGWTYCCQGHFVKAEELLVVAVDKTRRLLNDDHPDTQAVIDSLLQTYRGLCKQAEAAELEKLIIHKSPGV